MRKLTVASLAVAAVISAGAGAAAASAAGPGPGRMAVERDSTERHPTRATRDRGGVRDRSTSSRHDAGGDRAHGMKADR